MTGPAALILSAALLAMMGGCGSPASPANMNVRTASGALLDLTGTTWTFCDSLYPVAGQSYWHSWYFTAGAATILHEVHTASTDCTGATDPGQHFSTTMSFDASGGDRVVGWKDATPPTGRPASVTATGATFSAQGMSRKGVVWVDDGPAPDVIFLTNPGDAAPPVDADGYPTVLPVVANFRQ
jgi:hypothetical protein